MSDQPLNAPVPNLPLLRKVLDHIDAHPDEWNQSDWAIQTPRSECGTAFCIAGHAAVMAGADPLWEEYGTDKVRMPDGSVTSIQAAADSVLGLTPEEADAVVGLFSPINTRADVQRFAERIAERAGEVL